MEETSEGNRDEIPTVGAEEATLLAAVRRSDELKRIRLHVWAADTVFGNITIACFGYIFVWYM